MKFGDIYERIKSKFKIDFDSCTTHGNENVYVAQKRQKIIVFIFVEVIRIATHISSRKTIISGRVVPYRLQIPVGRPYSVKKLPSGGS